VIWVIATSLATVQTTVLALWLTSQLRLSPARCPSPDADLSEAPWQYTNATVIAKFKNDGPFQ